MISPALSGRQKGNATDCLQNLFRPGCGAEASQRVAVTTCFGIELCRGLRDKAHTVNFPDCLKTFFGLSKRTRSIAPGGCPRFLISSAAFGTASGSLTPQSQALFIQSFSRP